MSEPSSALTVGDRVGRSFLGGLAFGMLVFLFVGVILWIPAAAAQSKKMQELYGYSAIFVSPLAAGLGMIAGLVFGAMTPKGRLRWRALQTTGVMILLALGWIYYLSVAG